MSRIPIPSGDSTPDNRPARILKKIIPWVVLALIFAFLFSRVPLERVLAEFAKLNFAAIASLAVLCLVFIGGVSVLDGIAMWYGFSRMSVKIPWREMVKVRAAMMLLASIATLIGQAGLATHLSRKHRIPAGPAAGMVMFLFLVEIFGMVTIATIGLPLLLLARGKAISGAPVELAIFLVCSAWGGLLIMFMAVRAGRGTRVLEKLRLAPILHHLHAIGPREFLTLLGLKTILAGWQVALTIPAFIFYGTPVRGLDVMALMPLATIVSSIPITPFRLGTTQLSWVAFFQYAVDPEALVAFSLLLQFMLNVSRWLVGALVLPFVYRELAGGADEESNGEGQGR